MNAQTAFAGALTMASYSTMNVSGCKVPIALDRKTAERQEIQYLIYFSYIEVS